MYSTVIGAAPGNLSNPGQVLPFFAIDASPQPMHRAPCRAAAMDVSPQCATALWFDRKTWRVRDAHL